MTPPRDVQDYEAQAGKLFRAVMDAPPRTDRVGMIAAALRAASNAALERAAQLCQDDATYQERGDPRGMALSTAAQRIRALIAPAPKSPPATEPKKRTREEWTALADEERRGTEQGMAFLDTVGRDGCMAKPAPAPESPPASVNACQVDLRTDKDRECFEDVVQAATRILRAEPPAPSTSQAAPTEPQPEPPHWRNGRHYAIHVYRGDTPIATFHTVEAAKAAVRAYNASLDRSEPAPDLAAQLDELSNALASHADAETGAKWDRLRAAVGAHDERMAALEAALAKAHDAIRWACGDEPLKDGRWFDCRAFGYEDNAAPRYWWRSILRLYSGLPDAPAPSKEPPP